MGANIQNRRFNKTIKKLNLKLCLRWAVIVLEHLNVFKRGMMMRRRNLKKEMSAGE